jgi:hypothetical protein
MYFVVAGKEKETEGRIEWWWEWNEFNGHCKRYRDRYEFNHGIGVH